MPEAVKALLEQNPNATELEKRTVEVSVLFLDIAGYTRLSEQLDPKQLNRVVQTYFSSFLEIIPAHHGDVNETAGDGRSAGRSPPPAPPPTSRRAWRPSRGKGRSSWAP